MNISAFNEIQEGNQGAALFIITYIGFYGQQLKETQKQRRISSRHSGMCRTRINSSVRCHSIDASIRIFSFLEELADVRHLNERINESIADESKSFLMKLIFFERTIKSSSLFHLIEKVITRNNTEQQHRREDETTTTGIHRHSAIIITDERKAEKCLSRVLCLRWVRGFPIIEQRIADENDVVKLYSARDLNRIERV
jgi:hypothetical protein